MRSWKDSKSTMLQCTGYLADAENSCCRAANFNNPHHNVGLPVFTIHGNHDDPAGVDNLSAVDVLSSCKLVNYFGKAVCFRPRRHESVHVSSYTTQTSQV